MLTEDWQPSQAYYAFAAAAGCNVYNAYLHNGSQRYVLKMLPACEMQIIDSPFWQDL